MKWQPVYLISSREVGEDALGNPRRVIHKSDPIPARVSGSWYANAESDGRTVTSASPQVEIQASYADVMNADAVEVDGVRYKITEVYEIRSGWQLVQLEAGRDGKRKNKA